MSKTTIVRSTANKTVISRRPPPPTIIRSFPVRVIDLGESFVASFNGRDGTVLPLEIDYAAFYISSAADAVTNVNLADMPANTLKLRRAPAGDPEDIEILSLTEHTAFAAGDMTLVQRVSGELVRVSVQDLDESPEFNSHITDLSIHFTEASILHGNIQDVGINTHAQIDTHLVDSSIHFTEASIIHGNILNSGTRTHNEIDIHIGTADIHVPESQIDHTNITNIGTKTHAELDTHLAAGDAHIADGTIHFTVASIDHTLILNVGTNTHAQIDTHIAGTALQHDADEILFDDTIVSQGFTQVQEVLDFFDEEIALRETAATGVISGGLLTEVTPTAISVAAGTGEVVNAYTDRRNPTRICPIWAAVPSLEITMADNVGLQIILVDSSGTVFQQALGTTPSQRRTNIILGFISYSDGVITSVDEGGILSNEVGNMIYDWIIFTPPSDRVQGLGINPVDANLQIFGDSGSVIHPGINVEVSLTNPNIKSFSAIGNSTTAAPFDVLLADGSLHLSAQTTIPELIESPLGTVIGLSGNTACIHYIYRGLGNQLFLQLGQTVFSDGKAARDSLEVDRAGFSYFTNNEIMLLSAQVYTQTTTSDFTDSAQAGIVSLIGAGAGASGGVSVSDFLSLSDVTETTYVGQGGKLTQVDSVEGGVEFTDGMRYGTTDTGLSITASAATEVPFRVTAAAAQSANIAEFDFDGGTGGNAVVVDAAGNMGMSTVSPLNVLHLDRDQNAITSIIVENQTDGTGARATIELRNNGVNVGISAVGPAFTAIPAFADALFLDSGTKTLILSAGGGTSNIQFYAQNRTTPDMQIQGTSGNVAIGTSTFPTGTATKVFVLGDNVGVPTMGSGTAGVSNQVTNSISRIHITDDDGKNSMLGLHVTPVKVLAYTAFAGDFVRADVGPNGDLTVTLPASPKVNDRVGIAKIGSASAGIITVDAGANTIVPLTNIIFASITTTAIVFANVTAVWRWTGTLWQVDASAGTGLIVEAWTATAIVGIGNQTVQWTFDPRFTGQVETILTEASGVFTLQGIASIKITLRGEWSHNIVANNDDTDVKFTPVFTATGGGAIDMPRIADPYTSPRSAGSPFVRSGMMTGDMIGITLDTLSINATAAGTGTSTVDLDSMQLTFEIG